MRLSVVTLIFRKSGTRITRLLQLLSSFDALRETVSLGAGAFLKSHELQ